MPLHRAGLAVGATSADPEPTESEVDIQQLRECTDERLADLDKSLRREIFEARIKNATSQLDDTASIRRAKRDLARVKTIISERAQGIGPRGEGEAAEETEQS